MGLVEEHLNFSILEFSILFFQVRITDAEGRSLTRWSDRLDLARDADKCGAGRPPLTPTPTPGPFPPTSPVRGVAGDLWADVILGKPDFSQMGDNSVVPFKVFNPGRRCRGSSRGSWDSVHLGFGQQSHSGH